MTVPAFECPSEWTNDCGCPEAHNSCWPEPLVSCCSQLQYDETTPEEQIQRIEMSKRIAVQILHAFSGRQFGLCRRVVRPCRDDCSSGTIRTEWNNGQLQPILESGVWYNSTCSSCRTDCSCTTVCEVTFGGRIDRIIEIRIDGLVVSPLDYRVDNGRKLVAQGDFCWPTCQDMTAPAGGAGTWTVEYLAGRPVPEAGRWAAGLLACEFVKACTPDDAAGDCALPDNITQIVREGLTMDVAPFVIGGADGKVEWGRTGVPEVDLWLTSVNPHQVTGRARAYSPDKPPMRRTTSPCP